MITRLWRSALAMALFGALSANAAHADPLIPSTQDGRHRLIEKMDQGRIGIVTGSPAGTYIRLGSDMRQLVEDVRGDSLRVIVMAGRGSLSNLVDLSFLKNTDLALVQSDVLLWIAKNYPDDFAYLNDSIAYVSRFHPELIHIVVRGTDIATPQDLAGKRVAIGAGGSGSAITASTVLGDMLGIPFTPVDMNETAAFNDLLSDKPTVQALVYVSGRGSALFSKLSADLAQRIADKQIHFVPLASTPASNSPYESTRISDADYPGLIPAQQSVTTWAVPAVLAVYDWDRHSSAAGQNRYRRIRDFVDVFFDHLDRLDDGEGGYDQNWCTIDVACPVGGWRRIGAASDWLRTHRGARTAVCRSATPPPCGANLLP